MSLHLTREADLADEWQMGHEQFRLLRRRHGWSHVRFSRQDIRYTDEQVVQIVRDLTTRDDAKPRQSATGQTERSARRVS